MGQSVGSRLSGRAYPTSSVKEGRGQRTEDRGQGTEDKKKQKTAATEISNRRMCIPTRVVAPTVSSTAGFLRTNITRINKARPSTPLHQNINQPRNFATFKTNPKNNGNRKSSKDTPACPVVTYVSIITIFTFILFSNHFQHQTRRFDKTG